MDRLAVPQAHLEKDDRCAAFALANDSRIGTSIAGVNVFYSFFAMVVDEKAPTVNLFMERAIALSLEERPRRLRRPVLPRWWCATDQ